MKKKIYRSLIALSLSAACFMSAACRGEPTTGGGTVSGMITVDPLTLEGFDETYLPDKNSIQQRSGSIDLVLDFQGTVPAWQALADEYERLQGGAVIVNINKDLTGDAYKKKLDQEAKNAYISEWDIVQGNLISGNVGDYCVDMYSSVNEKNAYAGADNYAWMDVLEEQAYEMETVASNSTYIMNTEGINTAWFVNSVALAAAAELGYKNASGKAETPETWDDIVNLCYYMKQAGYTNPLGLSLDQASVQSNQFTWLVRVYGDYYYRDEYINIIKDGAKYEYKPDDTDLERFISESTIMRSRLYSCILDDSAENADYYVGPTSEKFKDFLTQLGKLKPYISSFNVTTSQEDMRDGFKTQNKGKDSPQIMLDYLGQGLGFASAEKTGVFEIDFFDYPAMTSTLITDNRIVRDVGGSGGWLSVLKKGDKAQTDLSIDFIKFVMSPYGQTIYCNALQEIDYYPNGMTLVKGEYVSIPDSWREFFDSDKITWNGLVDSNEFIRNLLRGFGGQTEASSTIISLYQTFMSNGTYGVDNFAGDWYAKIVNIWEKWAPTQGWPLNETKSTLIDRTKEFK